METKRNPIKYTYRDNKVAMHVGNMTIVTKTKSKKLRNLLCSELKLKGMVFGKRGEKKLKKSK